MDVAHFFVLRFALIGRVEDLIKMDICFMWLAGIKRSDLRTIN